ncbi:MAG: hypothetical protein ACE5J3_12590, partial [Methanosarcinales archaeon]
MSLIKKINKSLSNFFDKIIEKHKPTELDIIRDTIEDSMFAMTEKYGLKAITLATIDGFVIASTSNTASDDAAKYSYILSQHRDMDIQGALILVKEGIYVDYVDFAETEVVCIISSKETLQTEKL